MGYLAGRVRPAGDDQGRCNRGGCNRGGCNRGGCDRGGDDRGGAYRGAAGCDLAVVTTSPGAKSQQDAQR